MKKVRDYYFKKAKQEGYVARSVYKLEEIDRKYKIIKLGGRALDLGSSPGSWMQYISRKIGPRGIVVGVDRNKIHISLKPNMRFIHSDIYQLDLTELETRVYPYNLVCADMAPKTTGVAVVDTSASLALCRQALLIADQWLKKRGTILLKIFQGEALEQFVKDVGESYEKVKIVKPKSSRNESREVFILALDKINSPCLKSKPSAGDARYFVGG